MAHPLERGRQFYARRAWRHAYKSLSRADQAAPLGAEDLELLATSAYMIGRDDDYLSALERAHHPWLDAGQALRAVRCAFWLGVNLALRAEMGPATGGSWWSFAPMGSPTIASPANCCRRLGLAGCT